MRASVYSRESLFRNSDITLNIGICRQRRTNSWVLNREDWPGKKEEFYTGNFGALSQAREAGYDLILVGIVDNYNPLAEIIASSKLIEVESGITLWYGKTTAHTMRRDYHRGVDYLGIEDRQPSKAFGDELEILLTKCVANEILSVHRQP